MKYIDLHSDTLCVAFEKQDADIFNKPEYMVDINRLNKAGVTAQFFAIYMPERSWLDGVKPGITDDEYIDELAGYLTENIARHSGVIALATNCGEMEQNGKNGKVSAFLTVEDGRSIAGSFDKFDKYYNMGVRLVSLTHNFENCFGYPNSLDKEIMSKGLKPFGKEAIRYMNEKGIIIDVSHLSDGGFWDVMQLSKKPVVASHSCARALTPHQRNLTDEMIKALADNGGVCGINFCPMFVTKNLTEDSINENSTLRDITRHTLHLINVGGSEFAAIGTDFDGIPGKPEISDPTKMDLLGGSLVKAGISYDTVEKVFYKNAERVIKETL